MSLIHRSISSRLVVSSLRRTPVRAFATTTRYNDQSAPRNADASTESPAERPDSAKMTRQEGPAEGAARHNPDYEVAADYRTS
jgi:hypothetical protein